MAQAPRYHPNGLPRVSPSYPKPAMVDGLARRYARVGGLQRECAAAAAAGDMAMSNLSQSYRALELDGAMTYRALSIQIEMVNSEINSRIKIRGCATAESAGQSIQR